MAASPSGTFVATIARRPNNRHAVRIWNANAWTMNGNPLDIENSVTVRFLTDDVFACDDTWGMWLACRVGVVEPLGFFGGRPHECRLAGDMIQLEGAQVHDLRTWQRLRPPPGRKFHPGLARFTSDGRFLFLSDSFANGHIVDTKVEKEIPVTGSWRVDASPGVLPGLGIIWAEVSGQAAELHLLPEAHRLEIDPTLLQLWVQVCVRGELDENGSFVKWNVPTWEKKRQELGTYSPPFSDWPFPGYVATDRLHWLRSEYFQAANAEKPRLAKMLLHRAEQLGDRVESARWQAALKALESMPSP